MEKIIIYDLLSTSGMLFTGYLLALNNLWFILPMFVAFYAGIGFKYEFKKIKETNN